MGTSSGHAAHRNKVSMGVPGSTHPSASALYSAGIGATQGQAGQIPMLSFSCLSFSIQKAINNTVLLKLLIKYLRLNLLMNINIKLLIKHS